MLGIISLRTAALTPNERGPGQTGTRRGILGQDLLEKTGMLCRSVSAKREVLDTATYVC